ncbi:MAG: PAS domain S-box protein [Syntrophobacteraceae bacterium]|jgi:PAS domain S-box-containing protein
MIEITARKRAEELIRIRLGLLEFAASHSLEDLLQKTLDEVGALTKSPIGFYHFVESDGKTLSLQALSTQTTQEFFKAGGNGLHCSMDRAGVWADCVHERRPVLHNDHSALPHRKGMPAGHASVIRELVVPIVRTGKVVAMLGIGNKPTDYDDKDIEIVSYLADVAWEITERKQGEQALWESESKFRSYVEHAPLAVLVADRAGRILDFNPSATELLGYEANTLSGKNILDLHPEEGREAVLRDFNTLLEKGHVETEHRMRRRDGSLTWVSLHAVMITDQLSFAYCQDITERKLAQEKLRESEERYRSVIENMQDVFYRTDESGAIVMVSPSGTALFGYDTLDDMRGKPVESFWMYPEEREKLLRALRKDGVVRDYEVTLKKKDGSPLYVSVTSTFRKDRHGNILGVEGVIRDITERKQNQESLLLSEDRYRRLFEDAVLGIFQSTLEGKVINVNPAYARMHGFDSPEQTKSLVNDVANDLYADPSRRKENVRMILDAGGPIHIENRYKRKDGSVFTGNLHVWAVRDKEGKPLYTKAL